MNQRRHTRGLVLLTILAFASAGITGVAEATTPDDSSAAAEQAALEAAGGEAIGGSVSLLGVLGDAELEAFEGVLAPFESATGIDVQYESNRDIGAVLQTRVDGGNPPDLAANPGVGQMIGFAEAGELVDISSFLDPEELARQYDEALLGGVSIDDQLFGIYTAINLEGLIWYNPHTYTGPTEPASFDELQTWAEETAASGTTPWCIGLESGPASGWPGVVWLTELVLRGAGPEVHTQWWRGEMPWTSPEIAAAFTTFGSIATDGEMVNGGPTAVLATNFANGGDAMFADPPSCYLHHQASFYGGIATANFPELEPITDIAAFPFPDVTDEHAGLRQVSGEVLGMFNDTPQARALVGYLAIGGSADADGPDRQLAVRQLGGPDRRLSIAIHRPGGGDRAGRRRDLLRRFLADAPGDERCVHHRGARLRRRTRQSRRDPRPARRNPRRGVRRLIRCPELHEVLLAPRATC